MFLHKQFSLYPTLMDTTYMNDITYTHKDLATLVNVSETTIKSYRKKIPNCLPISNTGKPIRFSKEAIDVCMRIKELFLQGMAVHEVQFRLAEEFTWIEKPSENKENKEIHRIEPTNGADVSIPLNAIAQGVMNILQQQKDVIRKLRELEDTIASIQNQIPNISIACADSLTNSSQSSISGIEQEKKELSQGMPNIERRVSIPQYLMEYPIIVNTESGYMNIAEGFLPSFTLFDLLAILNHNFRHPEQYTPATQMRGQTAVISFSQHHARNPQTFSVELTPVQHNAKTALLIVGFSINNTTTPVETFMNFIRS